jgi:hypothetical protein
VSWQSHLGGALGGVLAAMAFRRSDPLPPRRRYSWEIEEEEAAAVAAEHELEPPKPRDVPVLWVRPEEPRGVVLHFRPRQEPPEDPERP